MIPLGVSGAIHDRFKVLDWITITSEVGALGTRQQDNIYIDTIKNISGSICTSYKSHQAARQCSTLWMHHT